MHEKSKRLAGALVLLITAAIGGYFAGSSNTTPSLPILPETTVTAPSARTTRVVYSLDQKQNDKEIIALINAAQTHVYFAMYEFTLHDIADALVTAKKRGLDVRGLVDAGESASSYDKPIMQELAAAGIPVETEKHPDGNGIMHIKAIVTDGAYAIGSYNWTESATTENDEILEIGTDPTLVKTYTTLLTNLFATYKGTNAAAQAAAPLSAGDIDYTLATAHINERATVHGTLVDAYTAQSGTVFLDFCSTYKTCPFSGVIFADDVPKFQNLSQFVGHTVALTGTITSYQGHAEMVLSDPSALTSH